MAQPPGLSSHGPADVAAEPPAVAALTGVRGLAIAIVVVSHLGNSGLRLLPIPHDSVGKIGVWIFFALSAYLLTSRLATQLALRRRGAALLGAYAIHRVMRIYPLLLLVLVAHVLLGDLSPRHALANALLLEGWDELWAISVECRYYLVVPIVALLAASGRAALARLVIMLLAALSIALSLQWPGAVFSNGIELWPRLLPFLCGSWLALRKPAPPHVRRDMVAGAMVAASLLACAFFYRRLATDRLAESFSTLLSLAVGSTAMGLVALARGQAVSGRWLKLRLLVWLGDISFSLYLVHMFVIRAVVVLMVAAPPMLQAWLSVVLMLGLASLTHWAIERPGIRRGRRWASRLDSRH